MTQPISLYSLVGHAKGRVVSFHSVHRAMSYIARMEEIYGPYFSYFWRP